jgi:hypothetical protein
LVAEVLLSWFGGATPEEQAPATCDERRTGHGLPTYQDTLTLGRELRQLVHA